MAGFAIGGFEDMDFTAFAGAIAFEEQGEARVGGVVELEGDLAEFLRVFFAAMEAPRDESIFQRMSKI